MAERVLKVRTSIWGLRKARIAVGVCCLLGSTTCDASLYDFQLLRSSPDLMSPSICINDNGAVAFWDGLSLCRAEGQIVEQLYSMASVQERFQPVLAIDPAGNVAFYARPLGVAGLYRTGPDGLRAVATAAIVQQWSLASISMNSESKVAYEVDPVGSEFWRTWVTDANGATTIGVLGGTRGSQINDRGEIVYLASSVDYSLRLMSGGQSRVIGPASFYVPAMNNSGLVAALYSDKRLYIGDGLTVNTFMDCALFSDLGGVNANYWGSVDINDVNAVAFQATTTNESGGYVAGIYTGSDPVADKVVTVGDTLFGKQLTSLHFTRGGLNNSGQIAFFGGFSDGSKGVIVASPVPEPSTACLAVVIISALVVLRARRRPSG